MELYYEWLNVLRIQNSSYNLLLQNFLCKRVALTLLFMFEDDSFKNIVWKIQDTVASRRQAIKCITPV